MFNAARVANNSRTTAGLKSAAEVLELTEFSVSAGLRSEPASWQS